MFEVRYVTDVVLVYEQTNAADGVRDLFPRIVTMSDMHREGFPMR
jgi:hypothetical protein